MCWLKKSYGGAKNKKLYSTARFREPKSGARLGLGTYCRHIKHYSHRKTKVHVILQFVLVESTIDRTTLTDTVQYFRVDN